MVKLTVVGCSPAWPNPGGAHSGYLLEHDGGRLLVDCGPGVLARLRREENWPRIDAIVITHFHLDHCGDLVAWLWGHLHVVNGDAPAPALWLPPSGRADLANLASRFEEVFPVHEYADGEPFEAAGFEVTAERVLHYELLAFGFRASANGSVLAYSGDSGPSDALPRLAEDADLFVCEATLLAPNPEGGTRGHLASDEAVEAFEAAGAKRLLITHRPRERPLDSTLEQAHDGMELEVK